MDKSLKILKHTPKKKKILKHIYKWEQKHLPYLSHRVLQINGDKSFILYKANLTVRL